MRRPYMLLDATLPATELGPVDANGEHWEARARELDELRVEAPDEYEKLRAETVFVERPYLVHIEILPGRYAELAAALGWHESPLAGMIYSCHPETWATFPRDYQEQFVLIDEEEAKLRFSQFILKTKPTNP